LAANLMTVTFHGAPQRSFTGFAGIADGYLFATLDGIFIVQLNCPHTSMPLPLKT